MKLASVAHKQVPVLMCSPAHGTEQVLRGRGAPHPRPLPSWVLRPPLSLQSFPQVCWEQPGSQPGTGTQGTPSYPEANEKLETGTVIVMLSLGYANKI